MKLENFIKKIISDIEKSSKKINKNITEINFDIFVDIKNKNILVQDYKSIKDSKKNLNKIKFSLKNIKDELSIEQIFDEVDKK
jgi:hypothetical protein